ncbi:MAG: cation-translocating P-type ATPase [Candidatus Heimdallarchaeaceae archaeon]
MSENSSVESLEEVPWFSLEKDEVFKRLSTSEKGLTEEEVQERLLRYGENKIIIKERFKILKMIIEQFQNFLVLLLVVAGAISLGIGIYYSKPGHLATEIYDAIAIYAIVFINATIGFIQDYRSNQALEKLKEYFEQDVVVLRNGKEKIVPSSLLVPGDIVLVEAGDKIPADCRIIDLINLKVDEAPLTGESSSITKNLELVKESARVHERKNMVFMGTTCVYGRAKLVVVKTGMSTEMGQIAELTQVKTEMTPLQKSLDSFGKSLGAVILAISAVVMAVEIFVELHLETEKTIFEIVFESFETAIALAISAVPEGLAAAIVITLAIGVSRMAKKRTIVSRLPAVETLGSVNYICSDKTGTLTRNEMTVKELWTLSTKMVEVGGSGYLLDGEFTSNGKEISPRENQTLDRLLEISYHCNNSSLIREGNHIDVKGDPTEAALLVVAEKAGYNENMKRERVHEIFFDSDRKRMTTVHKHNSKYIAFMKGSPPIVLQRCKHALVDGKIVDITKEMQTEIEEANLAMSSKALRVLAAAYRELPGDFDREDPDSVEVGMIFVGLTGMIDPPRPKVKEAIQECKEAGITTLMITGDQKATAVAVAKEIGILQSEDDLVVNGEELDMMTDEELQEKIGKIKVYSRMSPKDKYRVVETLQKMGNFVAVTGDGVNDAPALRKADIGVAMGITGTDVTKEVADMVITDDAFTTIVDAVEEGRNIFANMKRFIRYTLSSNFDELFAVLLITAWLGVLPFTPLQILFLNLLTDALPALALSFEPYDPRLMKRPPRGKDSSFLKEMYSFAIVAGIVAFFASTSMFLLVYFHLGPLKFGAGDPRILPYAQLMAFIVTLSFELVFVFIARNDNDTAFIETNPLQNAWLLWAVFISWILLFSVIFIAPLQAVFTSFEDYYYVFDYRDVLWILLFTVGFNIFIEMLRYVLRIPRFQNFVTKIGLA